MEYMEELLELVDKTGNKNRKKIKELLRKLKKEERKKFYSYILRKENAFKYIPSIITFENAFSVLEENEQIPKDLAIYILLGYTRSVVRRNGIELNDIVKYSIGRFLFSVLCERDKSLATGNLFQHNMTEETMYEILSTHVNKSNIDKFLSTNFCYDSLIICLQVFYDYTPFASEKDMYKLIFKMAIEDYKKFKSIYTILQPITKDYTKVIKYNDIILT